MADLNHSKFDCLIVAVLTHGINGKLYSTDGDLIAVEDITSYVLAQSVAKKILAVFCLLSYSSLVAGTLMAINVRLSLESQRFLFCRSVCMCVGSPTCEIFDHGVISVKQKIG